MGQSESFINGNCFRERISWIQDNSSCFSRCIESKDLLKGQIETGNIELLKHYLNKVLSIFFCIPDGFGKEYGAVFWSHLKLIKESVMPHFFHVWHIDYDAIDDGARDVQHSLFGSNFISNIDIFLIHADHLSWLFRLADYCREVTFGRVVTSQAHFNEARTAVYDECRIGIVH